jgi:hypothetical protein
LTASIRAALTFWRSPATAAEARPLAGQAEIADPARRGAAHGPDPPLAGDHQQQLRRAVDQGLQDVEFANVAAVALAGPAVGEDQAGGQADSHGGRHRQEARG